MFYQLTMPPMAASDKQADELGRLLTHAKALTVQFVTVAGAYKPTRARLTVCMVPDRLADQAARVMAVICGAEDVTKPSQAMRPRPEWTHTALLLPTRPDAPPLDGRLLDGWDSVLLTVSYWPGRAMARLRCCVEDAARMAAMQLDGWQVIVKPNPLQQLRSGARPWTGTPSLVPVPGGVAALAPSVPVAPVSAALGDAAPAPLAQEIAHALTDDPQGFLLGVASDGSGVRLARRAMTLSVSGSPEARSRAVIALLRHGMQAGMGVVTLVDRALLPAEALRVWESRARVLDVQAVTESSAVPWREIAPDLLAQAIGGPDAVLAAPLPTRFGNVLEILDAAALRVPEVLGLATMPGDNLRGVLAAGGLIAVPQDGDAASTLVARLLLAYLATPPTIGRGVLVLTDAGLVPPEALRAQALQVVLGSRSDALLRLEPSESGWMLRAPDGTVVAELLPDLLMSPSEGAGDLVDSIVRDIGTEAAEAASASVPIDLADDSIRDVDAVQLLPALAEIVPGALADDSADDGWWASSDRADGLNTPEDTFIVDTVPEAAAPIASDLLISAPFTVALITVPNAADLVDIRADAPVLIDDSPASELPAGTPFDAPGTADTLDMVLGTLLDTLMIDAVDDPTNTTIQAAIGREDFAEADVLARAWSDDAPQAARPWLWRVVLADADTERAVAAWSALQIDPAAVHVGILRRVLAVMDASEPATWLANLGDDSLAALFATDDTADDGAWPAPTDMLGNAGMEHAFLSLDIDTPVDAEVAQVHMSMPLFVALERPIVHPPTQVVELPASVTVLPPELSTPVDNLSDDALRTAWQTGESVPQLVGQLVASGMTAVAARARIRALLAARPTLEAPPQLAPLPVVPVVAPIIVTALTVNATRDGVTHTDETIWQRWAQGDTMEDLTLALCGKRGGPKADATRDRIYAVVVPRIVAELHVDDLLDRLAAGESATDDPRYAALLKRIARSALLPAGNLERSYVKRLISSRQVV